MPLHAYMTSCPDLEPDEEVVHILRHGISLEFATEKMKKVTAEETSTQLEKNQQRKEARRKEAALAASRGELPQDPHMRSWGTSSSPTLHSGHNRNSLLRSRNSSRGGSPASRRGSSLSPATQGGGSRRESPNSNTSGDRRREGSPESNGTSSVSPDAVRGVGTVHTADDDNEASRCNSPASFEGIAGAVRASVDEKGRVIMTRKTSVAGRQPILLIAIHSGGPPCTSAGEADL